MINVRGQLTRYAEGSVQELWTISYPLILSILSVHVMIFIDRLILAKYDMRAMNAAVVSWLVFSIFQCGTMGIASISEVFVGQYNGAKKSKKMGEPVWQMIWFSLMTGFLFIPLGLFAGPVFIPNPDYIIDGIPFFKTLMLFGPTFPLVAALASFFVGQGRVKLVMATTICSNMLSILFDFLLIFGIEGWLSPLGATGAAIATGIAQTAQAIVLLFVFLKKEHRELHGTNQWHFSPKLFWHTLRIGLPTSLSSSLDAMAWVLLAKILASVSEAHITVYSIGDSFFVLFGFGFWGLQKGITTVAANYIGANREELLSQTLQSGIKIVLAIMLCLSIPLFFFPEALSELFLNQDETWIMNETMRGYLKIALRWLWIYFLFDGISFLFNGILTAAGDTKFVMMVNIIGAWVLSILPIYICVIYLEGSPVVTWMLCVSYTLFSTLCCFLRYKNKRWNTEHPLHAST